MVVLKSEKWVHGGYTIAHANDMVYFIKGAIPGEIVECEIIQEKKDHNFALVKTIIEKSNSRIENKCSSFPICGGCSFLQISYEDELKLKLNLLKTELENKNIIFPEIKIQSGNPQNYRNNVQLKIKNGKIGFYKDKSDEIIPLPRNGCLILSEELNKYILNKNNKLPKDGKLRFSKKIDTYGSDISTFEILGKEIKIPANGFFQINRFLIAKWILEIKELITEKEKSILELFSGSGLISIFLEDKCESLIGLELDSNSVNFAKKNSSSFPYLNFHRWDLFQKEMPDRFSNDYLWIANPPRAGLGKLVMNKVSKIKPKQFIYSSCNYNTLVRDLIIFSKIGYKITFLEIFDFFPRTPYFETLVKLEFD